METHTRDVHPTNRDTTNPPLALIQDRFTRTHRHTRHPEQDRAGGGPEGADVLPPIPLVSRVISHCKAIVQV